MRDRRRSSSALSSDGFDYDDDTEMEESENQDAEDDVLNDEVRKTLARSTAMKLSRGFSYLGALWLALGINNNTRFA